MPCGRRVPGRFIGVALAGMLASVKGFTATASAAVDTGLSDHLALSVDLDVPEDALRTVG